MTGSLQRSHAVLVGIERYEYGERHDRSGPALDACRLGALLREQGMPEENLTVLVRPVPANQAAVKEYGLPVRTVTGDDLCWFFERELRERAGDRLLLYWSGHGFDHRNRQWVYYPEASLTGWHALNFEGELLPVLRSTVHRFPVQQIILDACRTLSADLRLRGDPVERPFSPTAAAHHDQEVLFAAARGVEAKNLPAERTGWFSRALREAIDETGGWPWDLGAIHAGILARADDPARAPVRLTLASSDGSVQELYLGHSEVRRNGEVVNRIELAGGPDQAVALGSLLSEVSELRDRKNLHKLAGLLDNRLRRSLPETTSHIHSGYDLCEALSKLDGGFAALAEVSRRRSDLFRPQEQAVATLQAALAIAAGPAGGDTVPSDLRAADAVGELLDRVPGMREPGTASDPGPLRRLAEWIEEKYPGLGHCVPGSAWDVCEWLAASTLDFAPLCDAVRQRQDLFRPRHQAVAALAAKLDQICAPGGSRAI